MSNKARKVRNFAALSGGALVAAAPLFTSGVANAAGIQVTSLLDDNGAGTTLREAIVQANGTPGVADTITFQAGLTGTITLTGGQLYITDDVTITGLGSGVSTVDADGSSRVFYVNDAGDVTIAGLTITGGDSSNTNGGAVYMKTTDLVLDGVVIDANDAGTGYGGGVYLEGGSLQVLDSTVSGNTASYGGGVYVESADGDILISDSTFTENYVTDGGGGLYTGEGIKNFTVQRSSFTDNTAGGDGGAMELYVQAGYEATISESTLSGNTAGRQGGALYVEQIGEGATLTISDSTITGNTADQGGGAYLDGVYGAVEIIDTVITGNTAESKGGGLYITSVYDTLSITGSTISGNEAGGDGGGVFFETLYGDVSIENSTISGNTSGECGGGLFFVGNYADASIENSTISGNTALYGGGIYVVAVDAEVSFMISHSTITGNSATAEDPSYHGGGGVYLGSGTVDLDHTVIAGNTSTLPGPDIAPADGASIDGSYSMVGDLDGFTLGGTHNLAEGDAKLGALADNGGPTLTHLPLAGSPLIDAGDPAFASPPATDQRGQARVYGGRIDIGAVEVGAAVLPPTGGSNGLMATLGAGLLALGGALHLTGRRKRSA